MRKDLLKITCYSVLTFCIVSYFSVIYSLLNYKDNLDQKPETNLGFPFHYYYQFWLRGSDAPNWGWDFKNFVLDCIFSWSITFIIFFIVKRKFK